jgi:hypothetical protein
MIDDKTPLVPSDSEHIPISISPKREPIMDCPPGIMVLNTNATSLEECRIIVVGEDHGIYNTLKPDGSPNWKPGSSRIAIWGLFAKFVHRGDIHLAESKERNFSFSESPGGSEYHASEGVIQNGWDDMSLVRRQREIHYKLLPKEREFVRGIKSNSYGSGYKIRQLEQEEDEIMEQRNDSLAESLEETAEKLAPGKRLVLTAGKSHMYCSQLTAVLNRLSEKFKYALVLAS